MLEILDALVLPNNLLASSITSDAAPANTVVISPAINVTFAPSADPSLTPSASTTVDPASGVQQVSPYSDSTLIAMTGGGDASTTTSTPADAVFQSGFTDLYADALNNSPLANPLPSATTPPSGTALTGPSAGSTAEDSGASRTSGPSAMVSGPSGPSAPSGPNGSSGPADLSGPSGRSEPSAMVSGPSGRTTMVSGPSGPIDALSGPSGPTTTVSGSSGPSGPNGSSSDSGGGYNPSIAPVYVVWSYLSTQTGGGSITRYGIDISGAATTTISTDSFIDTLDSWTWSDGSNSNLGIVYRTWDVSTTSTAVGGLTQHDWGTSNHVSTNSSNGQTGPFIYTAVYTNTAGEAGSQTQTTTAGATTSTWHWQQQDNETVATSTNRTTLVMTGSDTGNGTASDGSTYTGPYVQQIAGGAITGTDSGDAFHSSTYQFATSRGIDANGALISSGTSGGTGHSSTHDGYSGSGAYTIGASTASDGSTSTGGGTVTVTGSNGSTDDYSSNFTLGNNGSWQGAGATTLPASAGPPAGPTSAAAARVL